MFSIANIPPLPPPALASSPPVHAPRNRRARLPAFPSPLFNATSSAERCTPLASAEFNAHARGESYSLSAGLTAENVKWLRSLARDDGIGMLARPEYNYEADPASMAPGSPNVSADGYLSLQTRVIRLPRGGDSLAGFPLTNLEEIATRLEEHAREANARQRWGLHLGSSREPLHLAFYARGGVYARHRDAVGHFTVEIPREKSDLGVVVNEEKNAVSWEGLSVSDRAVSVIVQLSDASEYEGGELRFLLGTRDEPGLAAPDVNAIRRDAPVLRAPGCVGDVLVFPTTVVHEMREVLAGFREALVWWIPSAGRNQK